MDPEYKAAVLKVLREEGVVAVAQRFEVARFLSKLGTLQPDEEVLRFIAPHLTRSHVLELYAYLKQFRSETEWRAEFEAIFAAHASALPGRPQHIREDEQRAGSHHA
jgi:hypothetical protein